jgi:MobC-like protein
MEKKQPARTKWLTIRMSEEEYQEVEKLSQKTTCQSLSEYARKVILAKPVVMRYRNQSLDDFMTGMLQLQNELRAIGGNFNQVVRRLHALRHIPDLQQWILLNEQDKTRIFLQIESISNKINQSYQLWSRD